MPRATTRATDDDGDGEEPPVCEGDPGLSRRAFARSAVAIGGGSALSALLGRPADAKTGDLPYPRGDPSNRPERQHLWSPVGRTDQFGNPAAPTHQLVLLLEYTGDDPGSDRSTVETAFEQLERAFSYDQRRGLLFNVGYSPAYFRRQWGETPDADVTDPRAVSPHMDPRLDRQDAYLHLASDRADVVLSAEQALFGTVESVNGVEVEARLGDVFRRDRRRPVFVGPGKPAQNIDNPDIDPDAPLSMGFDSLFADAIPAERRVTIEDGPWADGTVAQVSKLDLDLEGWYDRDREQRVEEMFAADYTPAKVGNHGEGLGEGSGLTRSHARSVTDNARRKGVAGHGAKVARARDEEFVPKLLRRDGDVAGADGSGGLSFVGLVERIDDWFEVAEAMYDTDLDRTLEESATADGSPSGEKAAATTRTITGRLSGSVDDAEHSHDVRAADPDRIALSLSGPESADFDLYVTLDGRTPTVDDYDRRSWSYDSTESLDVDGADAGSTLGILVDSYSGAGEYTLTVEERGGACRARERDAVTGSVDAGDDGATFEYATGTTDPCTVTVSLSGPASADFDLYATLDGRTPSLDDYDRRSFTYGSDEELTCREVTGAVGILVHSYHGDGEFELTVEERGAGDAGDGGTIGGGDPEGHHERSGIAARMDVLARGHFLVPPRSLRSLPSADPR